MTEKEVTTRKIRLAAQTMLQSGVVLHPTETVYGLAAVWNDEKAIKRLCDLKNRPLTQPFSVMVSSINSITKLIGWESPALNALLVRVFPGPVTLLIENRGQHQAAYWQQFAEMGIRFPDHPLSRALIQQTGAPLLTTSANLSGAPSPARYEDVSEPIKSKADFTIDGGPCNLTLPSTIIKLSKDLRHYTVIREGAFDIKKFDKLFRQAAAEQQL